jgi:serine/threonine-protein kinase
MKRPGRRRVLATTGAALAAGLAGCSGGDGGDGGDGTDGGDGGSSDIEVPAEAESRAEDYLTADPAADNYDGITAMGSGSVTVDVGARGNGGNFAYAPAAIVVESGTTVEWDWVAGNHNVLAAEGSDFDLDSGSARRDDSYEFTFDAAGVGTYYCTPHQSVGMKGAVVVVG